VIGTFPVVAEPAFRANETAGEANNAKNAKATVTEVIDMGSSIMVQTFRDALLRVPQTFTPEFRGSPLRRRDCRARIGLQS
jgi:hypothetical protein